MLKTLAKLAMNEIELGIATAKDKTYREYTNRDFATNAYNQRTFQTLFKAECARADVHGCPLSLAILHLDHPESVAETVRDAATDILAKSFCEACNSLIRDADILARVSAKGFALLMPNTKCESAEIVVRQILKHVATDEPEFQGNKTSYSVSVGLAQLSPNQRATDLYKEAQKNLCTAQDTGQNRYIAGFAA